VKITIRKTRNEGEVSPPWYYALAYLDWQRLQEVWYPVPMNYIVRWFWKAKTVWDLARGRMGRTDYYIMVHSARLAREMATKYRIDIDSAMNEKFRLQNEQIRVLQEQLKGFTDTANVKSGKKK
jgi:hypothetical protein